MISRLKYPKNYEINCKLDIGKCTNTEQRYILVKLLVAPLNNFTLLI